MIEELLHLHLGVPQCAFECVSIDFVMEREYNPPPIWMLHLHMAAFAVDFHETHAAQGGQHLPPGKQREFHKLIETTSRSSPFSSGPGAGSKYNAMASGMFRSASSRVWPWDQQLFKAGQCAAK